MLIIALPHTTPPATAGYAHVHSDGHSVQRSATGAAATLSAHAGEVVAVVPHSRLAWLRVQLPPASHGARLQSVLQGHLFSPHTDLQAAHLRRAHAQSGCGLRQRVCNQAPGWDLHGEFLHRAGCSAVDHGYRDLRALTRLTHHRLGARA